MSLTKREAFVISAYTDILMLPFVEYHKMVEEQLDRPVWTHEMGFSAFAEELRESVRSEFIKICMSVEEKENDECDS